LCTDWFIRSETQLGLDLSGDPYISARSGPGLWVCALQTVVAIVWCFASLYRSGELNRREKNAFGASLSIYAAMGLSSLFRAFDWIQSEGVLEYGPLVVSIGASRVLAFRQRRLEASLQAQIEQRARELRESEARYRNVIENAPIGLLAVDASGKLVHANATLLAMLGSTRSEFEESFDVTDEYNAKVSGFAAMLERALRTGEFLAGDFEFDSWWGKHLSTHTSVAPWRDESGAIAGALALVENNTERRAFERQLERAQRLEAVGQLAAGIAHEINNPMAYVRANLSVLGEDLTRLAKALGDSPASAEARAQVDALEALRAASLVNVQRTVAIVRDLREFSRAAGGAREIVDVNAQLEQAARLASARGDGLHDIELALGDVPAVHVDPAQLRLALLSLLTHAQQAAGPGGHVRATTSSVDDAVLISVHDDGPPIPAAQRERLFEPFAVSRGGGEPTLGLYVTQQIVREHDGKLEVLSTGSHGTTFVVRLPAAAAASEPG
jgi:PAS domain S-box-containing protein